MSFCVQHDTEGNSKLKRNLKPISCVESSNRNKPVMMGALSKAFVGMELEMAEEEDGGIGRSSAVGAALFVL